VHFLSVFSLRNRALIALITVVVAFFGSLALTNLKQELIPSLTFPQLVVVTAYPGASPEVVNEDVSTPIETAVSAVPGLEATSATSTANLSTVSASFDYGIDITRIEQQVSLAVNRIRSTLPDGVDPAVVTGSIDDLPVIQIAVTSDLDGKALSTLLEGSVVTDFRALDGVRQVDLLGTDTQRLTITPDAEALAAAGFTTQDIRDALDANGVLLPSGSITENDTTLTVQSGARLTSADEVGALPLLGGGTTGGSASTGAGSGTGADNGTGAGAGTSPGAPTGAPATGGAGATGGVTTTGGGASAAPTAATAVPAEVVTIADVADVAVVDDPVTGISRVNGEPALTLAVTKTPDGNTVDVSHAVTALIPDIEESLGSGTELTVVFDQAPFIEESIRSLAVEGSLGLLFAVLVILVFLLSLRSTLVTAISIPASVLITFIGMQASGYTLNVITLGAITIAVGRVVDDSIVVIENIKRHLSLGEEKLPAILAAVKEVAAAITASTITTVAVFLPLALVQDITGELFRPFALTVTIALAASLFVALTIVPVLAYWLLGDPQKARTRRSARRSGDGSRDAGAVEASSRDAAQTPAAVGVASRDADLDETPSRLQRGYLPVLRWTLRRPVVTLVSALLVLAITGALAPGLKTNFIGSSGQNTLTVTQDLPRGTSLEAQDAAATGVESALIDVAGVDVVQLSLGQSGDSITQAFLGGSDITYSLTTDPSYDQTELRSRVVAAAEGVEDAGEVAVTDSSGGFASADIEVNVTANTRDALDEAAGTVLDAVSGLSVVDTAVSDASETQPFIAIEVDRQKAAEAGLSEIAVGGIVAEARLPSAVGSVVIDDDTLSIYIQNADAPATLQQLRDFPIPTAAGPVALSTLASVEQADGPSSITSVEGLRAVTITITPNSDDVGRASAAVGDAIDAADLPAGASAELGGVSTDQSSAFRSLGIALLIAILIVYVVMVATFKSLRQPLLLLVSIPFAATGAILLQLVSGIPLGVPSLIGVLMLIGIVVTNAIVLVDLINQYRLRGMRSTQAVIEGASRRLRPILMTALATIFALLPLAVGLTGQGGFISQPLAIIVIGGLVSSTLLTLVVLPVLYDLVEGAKERRTERRAAKAEATVAPG
jgi:HAE1 family hydrophobic/amphiphilic exporter-1